MWRLIVSFGKEEEQEAVLDVGSHRLGRSRDNEVYVPDRSLSRHHARLEVADEGVVLEDLGSKNGTQVDGVTIVGSRPLHGGEVIRCGHVDFTLLAPGQAVPQAATAVERPAAALDVTALEMADLLSPGEHAELSALRLPPGPGESRILAKLRLLLKASELLTSTASLEALLERVLDLAFEMLDIDRAALLLIDEDSGGLEERVTRVRAGSKDAGQIHTAQIHSASIARRVLRKGSAMSFANVAEDSNLSEAPSVIDQSIRAAMAAPMKPGERGALGLLYVDNVTRPAPFQHEDLEFLGAFANQAALAIDNARLQARLRREAVRRENLMRFFPPTTIDRLEESRISLDVVDTEVTILFADIADFTRLSSSMSPRRVVELLNHFFPRMARIVFRHGGTLEKYIGDALMAVWGAPLSQPDDAERAVRAAVEMQRAVELDRSGEDPEIRIHVGLNTGPVAAGNIGSETFLQYATIGDATNVASRVCALANAGEILVTEATLGRLGERPQTTPLAPARVKGKSRPLVVHRLDWRAAD